IYRYQCSECKYCSQNLEEATLHAVQVHGEVEDELHEESEDETLPKIDIKEDKDFLSEEESSSISLYKQSNGNLEEKDENSSNSNWPPEATKLLIETVQEHYSFLKDKRPKKKHVWELVSFSLENQFPDISASKCEQKWKNLLAAQKRYTANTNKSYGKSKVKKPEFYDEVAEVIGGHVSDINPEGESNDSIEASDLKKKNDVSSFSFQQDEVNTESFIDALNRSDVQGSDAVHLLGRLLSTLERREAANERFQREIIEIEKEKLVCVQRFLESREKFNSKRCQMMREWMTLQSRSKRKRDQ
ncbi:hypothetical protein Avbf_07569, partial [Armadillidium vulgare]